MVNTADSPIMKIFESFNDTNAAADPSVAASAPATIAPAIPTQEAAPNPAPETAAPQAVTETPVPESISPAPEVTPPAEAEPDTE